MARRVTDKLNELAGPEPDSEQLERERSLVDAIAEARAGDPDRLIETLWPDLRLEDWQRDIIHHCLDPNISRVVVKGNTGCGKGLSAALVACIYYFIWPDAKIYITRDTYDAAVAIMWGETDKWMRRQRVAPPGRILAAGAEESRQHFIRCVNPSKDEGFSGAHGEHVLFIFDEATAVPDRFWKLAATQAKVLLAQANPRTTSGAFRAAFPSDRPDLTQTINSLYGRARCITVSAHDCTNVKEQCLAKPVGPIGGIEIDGTRYNQGEPIPPEHYALVRPIIPAQTCYDEAQVLLNDPDPFQRNVFGLGRFPAGDAERQVVLPEWMDRACTRWTRWKAIYDRAGASARKRLESMYPIECFGLDVSGSIQGDDTVLAAGGRYGIRELLLPAEKNTMRLCDWVIRTIQDRYGIDMTLGQTPITVDADGIGLGVAHRLAELGCRVIEFHGGATANNPANYGNLRAEAYAEFGRRINPDGDFGSMPFILVDDADMRQELAAPEKIWIGNDGQRFYLTPKSRRSKSSNVNQTLIELLGRSPDKADACVYCHHASKFLFASLDDLIDEGFF